MTLEAVVYQQGHLGHNDDNKDLCSLLENWGWWDFNYSSPNQDHQDQQERDHGDQYSPDHDYRGHWDHSPPCMAPAPSFANEPLAAAAATTSSTSTRPKRRRARRSRKNQEEIENQRITHIAVERNRRKQMNEYLSVLKSLMPDSYSQRGDQASIVGGAINVVKELEQSLHCLSANKMQMANNSPSPFGDFFSFPQYSTTTKPMVGGDSSSLCGAACSERPYAEASRVADVEVTMVESHANLKIRSSKRPKQLPKIVSGLQQLRLNILHLNVITADRFALYSISLKVEDDSELNSADEIATAVHKLLSKIDEEGNSS